MVCLLYGGGRSTHSTPSTYRLDANTLGMSLRSPPRTTDLKTLAAISAGIFLVSEWPAIIIIRTSSIGASTLLLQSWQQGTVMSWQLRSALGNSAFGGM